jgi:hypothetical protein
VATHEGRVPATGERRYVVGWCDGTLAVTADRLVVQGEPHEDGRTRTPTVIERTGVGHLILRCGVFGAALQRETRAGFRSPVVRVRSARLLLDDLRDHGWPTRATGWRKPRG